MILRHLSVLALVGLAGCASTEGLVSDTLREPQRVEATMQVSVDGLVDGRFQEAQVFQGFGCTGQNRSPALRWSGAPEGTRSYAIVIHDPDAPTGVGFFHWIALDIPATTTSLAENASDEGMPEGTVQGYTDFGHNEYGGPCPPPGAPHRYEVTVYALSVPSLGLPPNATGALARFLIRQHTLALGRAVGTYGR